MKLLQLRASSLFHSSLTFCFLSLLTSSQALYFFLEGATPKCFYEELPKDTLVVGKYSFLLLRTVLADESPFV